MPDLVQHLHKTLSWYTSARLRERVYTVLVTGNVSAIRLVVELELL